MALFYAGEVNGTVAPGMMVSGSSQRFALVRLTRQEACSHRHCYSYFVLQLFLLKCDASQINGFFNWTIIPFIPCFAYSS